MAVNSTFYINAADFETATAVYLDSLLTYIAPDGYYSFGTVVRQQSGGILLAADTCGSCIPSCPDRRVVFQICNSNSIKDDNFDIYLNDTYIGAVDLNANAQVGSVFIADLNTAITLGSADFVCPLNLMVTYYFDPALLQPTNVLEMRNTQNNGAGNAGSVGIRNYLLTGTTLSDPCVITNLQYSGFSGDSFTFDFNYTQCCIDQS